MNDFRPFFDANLAIAAQQRDEQFVELARTKVRLEELEREHKLLATREANAMKRIAQLDRLAEPAKVIAVWRGDGWDSRDVPLGLAGALDELTEICVHLAKEGIL